MALIVRAGAVEHESRYGPLYLDRRLDREQLALVVAAMDRHGVDPRRVECCSITEAGATFTTWPPIDTAEP